MAERPSYDALIRQAARQLAAAGVEEPLREARLLLLHALSLRPETLIARGASPVTPADEARYLSAVTQRAQRIPFARIVGTQEFFGLPFRVSDETLIPRADTETLVEAVLAHLDGVGRMGTALRLLDLGTGTGAILGALLHRLPTATGVAVDVSDDALATAAANLDAIAPGSAACLRSSWFDAVDGRFDVIVSNPPYIPSADIAGLAPEVRVHEPSRALDGGPDGLSAYRLIAGTAARFLHPGGLLALEIGAGQHTDIIPLLESAGFARIGTRSDLGGHIRVVHGEHVIPPISPAVMT